MFHNIFSSLRGAFYAVAVIIPAAVQAQPAPALQAYGNLPDIEEMALSESGSNIAAVRTIGGERVVLITTSELDPVRIVRLQDAKIRSLEWVGDEDVLVVLSRTEKLGPDYTQSQFEFYHAIIIPADPSRPEAIVFGDSMKMMNAVFADYGVRKVDGKWQAYFSGIEKERGGRGYYLGNNSPALFAVDVTNNSFRKVADGSSQGTRYQWLLGPDGKLAAILSMEISSGSWSIRVPDGPTLAHGIARQGDAGLVSLGKDGNSLIYSALDDSDKLTRWYEVPLDGTGAPVEFIKAEEVNRTFEDRTNGQLLGLTRTGEDSRPEFFDPTHQRAVDRIYRAFPNLTVSLMDWTPDFGKVLVRTAGNSDSGTWYLVDLQQMRAEAVGYEREPIGPQHVGQISTVHYKAGDGLDLSGVLTLPPGREAKNLPVVMLPHGGPHSHDAAVFDWWAQAFASRGYAVFQPNFRGSTNRDEAFMRAGFGQWGRAMQTDISDGLAELARQGIVDPERACIVGASYGGYAALAGVTLQQGMYRCAVAVAPVSDLGMLFASEVYDGGRTGFLRRSLLEELGPRDGFGAISPRRFAAQADAPILLIHGKDDTVVPFAQSESMADALKNANKPHRLVVLRNEDHWLSKADTRLQMLEEAVAFVEQHNPSN